MNRSLWVLALVASLASSVLGAVWIWAPDAYPFGGADPVTVSVSHLMEHGLAGTLLLAFGLVGVVLTAIWPRARTLRLSRSIGVGALVEALFFGLVMSDVTVLAALAYALAMLAPIALLGLVILACVRRRRWAFVVALAILGLGLIGFGSGIVSAASLSTFLGNVLRGFAFFGSRIGWGAAMAALSVLWTVVAARSLHLKRFTRRIEPATMRRWGVAATVIAAGCPLPYAFIRLTWLTPWPLGAQHPVVDSVPTRIQGSLLGVAAIAGMILTLGLISRWGETFPRWVPGLGGRAVPTMLAVVPGAIVAGALTFSSPGWIVHTMETAPSVGAALYDLSMIPSLVWGMALGFAVLAYWVRRSSSASFDRTAETRSFSRPSRTHLSSG